jgi:hypothetical protein
MIALNEAPATANQKKYARDLLAQRVGIEAAEEVRIILNTCRERNALTAKLLSACITQLLSISRRTYVKPNPHLDMEAGVYVLPSGSLVRVYFGQKSGQLLAKVAIDGELVYSGTARKVLAAGSRKATADEIGAWGQTTGTCLICSRHLNDPESVDRGIGPVCFAKL